MKTKRKYFIILAIAAALVAFWIHSTRRPEFAVYTDGKAPSHPYNVMGQMNCANAPDQPKAVASLETLAKKGGASGMIVFPPVQTTNETGHLVTIYYADAFVWR